jgi:ABC-type oligopeptide transport system substrate-binding subunit
VLKRNENYWNKDEVQLDQLIGMCNISGDTAVEMMMTDMIDLAAFSDPTYYQQLYDLGFEGITYTIMTNSDTPFTQQDYDNILAELRSVWENMPHEQ